MMAYTLNNYEEQLNTQVIHMDQAVCYNPEFRATKMMHDYPSRKLQIARAIMKDELEPSAYSAKLMYQSLLSRQGERWQNFGENPEDCTDAMILSRAMMLEKGFGKEVTDALEAQLDANGGHLFKTCDACDDKWAKYMPVEEGASMYLFLDDATYSNAMGSARNLGEFLTAIGVVLNPEIKATFPGWEYFAHGMVNQGTAHVRGYLDALEAKGIDTILTMSGQTQYLLTTFVKKLGLDYDFRVINILDLVDELVSDVPVYLYAGTFYTRYLRMEGQINDLVVNTYEEKTRSSVEFIPLLDADARVNKVTIWQKPLGAEFSMFGFDEKTLDYIVNEAIDDIKKGTQTLTVFFDPYAYAVGKEALGAKAVYFADLL